MTITTHSNQLLAAFQSNNTHVPVWFMRQAGRYLPEYQKIRATRSLDQMFEDPDIAAEVTIQPVNRLGVDAAIMFADILTLPSHMGFNIHFEEKVGPVIDNPITTLADVQKLHTFEHIEHIEQIIKIVKSDLPKHIPLIGFAGSPFTVATYLIEGGTSTQYLKTLNLIQSAPEIFKSLMEKLTDNTIRYYQLQKSAGIDIFQLFESAAGLLPDDLYRIHVLPFVETIFNEVDLPSIFYMRHARHLFKSIKKLSFDILSVDHQFRIGEPLLISLENKGVQGNLFNGLVYCTPSNINKQTNQILNAAANNHPKFIFNLSHGVLKNTDPHVLKSIVDTVHSFSWNSQNKIK